MKFQQSTIRLLIVSVAALVTFSCGKESKRGVDSSLYGAIDLSYDDLNSGATTLAVFWNASPAIKAGAVSFTAQLVKKTIDETGDVYDTQMSSTFTIAGLEYPGSAIFSGLKNGSKYYVRARANYPDGRRSEWCYMYNNELERTAVVKVGTGLVNEPVSRVTSVSAKLAYATSSTLSFKFSSTAFLEYDTDAERSYSIGLYKDAECKDLVVSWLINPNCGTSFSASNPPSFLFSGLDGSTKYYFTVTDLTDSINTCSPIEAETKSFAVKKMESTVQPGDVILAEDFSEFVWGGSYLANENAAGYSSKLRGTAPNLEKAYGENPVDGKYQFYLVGVGQDMQLFGSLSGAIPNTRLANWGFLAENDNTACMCVQAGHLKCGTGAGVAQIVTPELSCLSGSGTVELSFDAQPLASTDGTNIIVEIIRGSSMDEKHCITPGERICAKQFTMPEETMPSKYSVTVENVSPGDRIAIGGDISRKQKTTRVLIDNIQIKLVKYE